MKSILLKEEILRPNDAFNIMKRRTLLPPPTKFFLFNEELKEKFNEFIPIFWKLFLKRVNIEEYAKVLGVTVDQAKIVLEEIIFQNIKYHAYGRLYEMASEGMYDEELEDMVSWKNHEGFIRLNKKSKQIEEIFQQNLFVGFVAAGYAPSLNIQKKFDEIVREYESLNRVNENAHNKIKGLMKNKRNDWQPIKLELMKKLKDTAEMNRKKNGKLNFSKIGKTFGITHHTAKKWCDQNKID
jgi:hypothetical protein